MTTPNLPSVEYLKECFDYNPDTGKLTWKDRPRHHFKNTHGFNIWNSRNPGNVCAHKHGKYAIVRLNGRAYRVHRIIYCLLYGHWPSHQIDHINGDKFDNRPENIRCLTNQQNQMSYTTKSSRAKSKWRGVSVRGHRFRAAVSHNGVKYGLGTYKSELEAALAYNYKAMELGFSPEAFNKVFEDVEL